MDLNTILNEHEQRIKDLFPKYGKLTDNIFEKIQEILSEDYDFINSDKKRLRTVKAYLYGIIQIAYKENGHKNYLKEVVKIFYDDAINKYLCKILNTERATYLNIIQGLKYSIIYWQGYEGNEDKKLYELLEWLR